MCLLRSSYATDWARACKVSQVPIFCYSVPPELDLGHRMT